MKGQSNKKGFTLVELIVVLVILAILIALLVPALTGYIDKSKKRSAMVECRQCVQAAQAIGSDAYGEGITLAFDATTEAEIEKLAEVDSNTVSETVWIAGKVTRLVYTSKDGITVIYENGKYTVGDKSISGEELTKKLKDIIKEIGLWGNAMDSGAMASSTSDTTKFIKALEKAGLNLSSLNATSWKYETATNQYGPFFYWTPENISTMQDGTKLPVMKYSMGSGNYTVYYATVTTKSSGGGMTTPYKVLNIGSSYAPSINEKNQTYSNMLKYYNEAAKN